MRTLLLLFFFSFLLPAGITGQFVEVWGTGGDEAIHGILATSDSGYIVYGLTSGSGEGQDDFMLIKYNQEDEVLWAYTYGTYGIENGHAVGLDEMPNGDLYLTGNWEEETNDPDRGIITKLTGNGEIIWTRMLVGTSLYDRDGFHQVELMPDGNLLAGGWAQSTSSGNQDPYVMKLTTDGDFIDGFAFGGNYPDHSYKMELDDDGFYLVHSGQSLGPGTRAAGLARLNYDLQLIWNKMYGSSGDESIGDMILRPDGNFLLFGRSDSFASERGFMMQVNAEGEMQWSKTVNAGAGIERINDALLLPDGAYIISMSSESENRVIIAKFDELNEVQWAKKSSFGSSSDVKFRADNQVLEGNEILCITDVEGIGSGGSDLEVIRYDPDFGPCDWEDVVLDVQDVAFDEEDIIPAEAIGGSLIEFELIRNDLTFDTISLGDCFIDYCQFDGAIVLPDLCEGEEVTFEYELSDSPPGTLTWEWQVGAQVIETEDAFYVADSDGTITLSLIITATDLPDCVQTLDTFFQVIPIPEFNILGPEVLCVGEIGTFEIDNVLGDIEWYNNETGPMIEESFNSDTEIEVTMGIGSCEASQTFQVEVVEYPTGGIIAPALFCLDEEITFSVGGEFENLIWGNGDTEETITVNAASDSTVSVTLSNGACSIEDSYDYVVLSPSEINSASDLNLCEGIVHQLSASGGENYLWSNGTTSPQANYLILSDTLVWVQGSNDCGGETIEIYIQSAEPSSLGLDTISLVGEYGEIEVVDLPAPFYYNVIGEQGLLCESCAELVVVYEGEAGYNMVYTDELGCEISSFINIETLPCTEVYLPNSFTPNNDGVNDAFKPVCHAACIDLYLLQVYDRAGQIVFESADPLQSWTGSGQDNEAFYVSNAVYTYRLKYRLHGSNKINQKLGSVTMLR